MRIILGSGSPRRKELLTAMGIDFEVKVADTDERYPEELEVEKVPVFIADQKAIAIRSMHQIERETLLCADTIVVVDGKILGKPTDKNEAIQMLELLSGKMHEVLTGVVIYHEAKRHEICERTLVQFKKITLDEMNYYVDNYRPYDKAGSYGIQEWIGLIAIERIEGSYTNVIGLPTDKVWNLFNSLKIN
ncbi:MAG: septum formation protein Maf [Bacteroidota bacterium]|jgi:septum formation protein